MKNYKFKIRGNQYFVDILSVEKDNIEVEVNGTKYKVEIEHNIKQSKTPTIIRHKVTPPKAKPKTTASKLSVINAPLPGNIFKLIVKEGDSVEKGDVLLIMEAMKMENNILAETSGVVKKIHISEGDNVLQNDKLIEIE
ncbi:MAG: acetyl-CoA carboxylase biotin carboxyl carrier protein subunit [Bacteroidetes bacterium]|nr:MAG: acetyl-CoA carboxylase biotin carboxyl carrier protein subunit [Bacteroidota bacterium]